MSFGVDYAYTRPTIATLKHYDTKFVIRYVSTKDNGKNLTKEELAQLVNAGIDVCIVYETTTNFTLAGRNAGISCAKSAESMVIGCGLPRNTVIYVAVDFQASPANISYIKDFFEGWNSIHGVTRTGVYGSYFTCRSLHAYGLVGYMWQTTAWSNGEWYDKANIRQVRNDVKWPDGPVDYDQSMTHDFGQYPNPPARKSKGKQHYGGDMLVFDATQNEPALCVRIPSGSTKVVLHADPTYQNHTQPIIRIGMHKPWAEAHAKPAWGAPATVAISGQTEMTFARTDAGNCPVTIYFE